MSKPEWCPADVWDTATIRMGIGGGYEMAGMIQTQREKIARAILAERERCAAQLEAMAEESDGQPRWAIFNEAVTAIRGGTAPIGAAATQFPATAEGSGATGGTDVGSGGEAATQSDGGGE